MRKSCRSAATVVEFAIIGPVTFLLLIGLLVGGLGIFRYQQVVRLAQESARFASVHGADYAKESGNPAATSTQIYDQVIAPKAAGLDPKQLSISVDWNKDKSPYHNETVNGQTTKVTNTVTVTVTYNWIPEAFLGGVTLRGTSTSMMFY